MSLNSEAIRMLLDKGLTGEDLMALALCLEKAFPLDTAHEKRKAYDRQRKRDQRAASTGNSTGNPPDPAPNDIDILTPTPDPVISNEITLPVENPVVKPEHVLEAYNAMAVRAGLPVAKMTPERRKKLPRFIKRHPIDDITEAIAAMERSPLCCGDNARQWKADFDFLLQPKSFTRLIEGTYGR